MISFIWSPGNPLPAGTGGSENYTVGQVRELNRRAIEAQVVTIGRGDADGRDGFSDVPFHSLENIAEIGDLDGTVVFVNEAHLVATKNAAFQIFHNPPPLRPHERAFAIDGTRDRTLIATSRYSARVWSTYLDVDVSTIRVVYPFAEPHFATEPRPAIDETKTRVLFAGRLSPEKGIYTLLATLHIDIIDQDDSLTFTATTAGSDKAQGEIIERLLRAHPRISVVPACTTPEGMAALMAAHDIVVMPSNSQYWHETFGIVSIEAQHVGCRVVASDDGGLRETDCGSVVFVEADHAEALAWGIRRSAERGPTTSAARSQAVTQFTVAQSVDALLEVLNQPSPSTPASVIAQLEELVNIPYPKTSATDKHVLQRSARPVVPGVSTLP